MAKRDRQLKTRGREVEINERIDDHILPGPEDILKYQEADPTLLEFIKNTAAKEQEFRHKSKNDLMGINRREQGLHHGFNYLGLIFAFIVSAGGLFMSYMLLIKGFELQGSVFGGGILVTMGLLFVRRNKKRS